jgi:hypothetical protein
MAQAQGPKPPVTAAEVRLRNGFRVVASAFVTILISFAALLYCYALVNPDSHQKPFTTSDLIAILGAVTTVVGTLVGSYFGVSSANGARETASLQAKDANAVAQRMLGQMTPDAARKITG